MQLKSGSLIDDRYRVSGVLAKGGMGTVYRCVDVTEDQPVALKVLDAHHAKDPSILGRFEREVRAIRRVESRHVVKSIGHGHLHDGARYLVMQLLEGESLLSRLKGGKTLPAHELVQLTIQLLDGLEAAHQLGVLHRDIKPANLFLEPAPGGETLKILDFGVSKLRDAKPDNLSVVGTVVGTPHYMAPEQAQGVDKADERSDLYAVGAIMYRGLAGRPPYDARTIGGLIEQQQTSAPPDIEDVAPNVDRTLAAVVHRAISDLPDDRYQTVPEFRAELQRWQSVERRSGAVEASKPPSAAPSSRVPDSQTPAPKAATSSLTSSRRVKRATDYPEGPPSRAGYLMIATALVLGFLSVRWLLPLFNTAPAAMPTPSAAAEIGAKALPSAEASATAAASAPQASASATTSVAVTASASPASASAMTSASAASAAPQVSPRPRPRPVRKTKRATRRRAPRPPPPVEDIYE